MAIGSLHISSVLLLYLDEINFQINFSNSEPIVTKHGYVDRHTH